MEIASDKYYVPEETMFEGNGLGQKDPAVCELYVDTHYIDYMMHEVTADCLFQIGSLKRMTNENKYAIDKLLENHDTQQKWVQTQMFRTIKTALRADSLMVRTLTDKCDKQRKRDVWLAWNRVVKAGRQRKELLKKIAKCFKKNHCKKYFN